jgi:hypothetical protein
MEQKTLELCILLQKISDLLDTLTTTVEATQMIGTGIVSWASRKQPIVTLFSAEAKYVAATSATCQVVWMRRMLKDFLQEQQEPTTLLCDNNSTIVLSKNHAFHKKTKHIDTRYLLIK